MQNATSSELDRIPMSMSFTRFFENYLQANRPCMLESDFTAEWRSRNEWLNSSGVPDCGVLKERFGNCDVPVVEIESESTYDSPNCFNMKFCDFLNYLENKQRNSDQRMLYLKDWHFQKLFPDYEAYRLPKILNSDWMNEYWDHKADPVQQDYRFLYFGPKDSWTPFHADVLRSFSWSANICGRKLWYLVPPGKETELLPDGNLPTDIRTIPEEVLEQMGVLRSIQQPGEIIFVPSNWHHQVHNLEDTISINHNWFNSANAKLCWDYIKNRLREVEKELADCRSAFSDLEWSEQTQKVLKADIGIDFEEFRMLLRFILKRRKAKLVSDQSEFDSNCQVIDDSKCLCSGNSSSLCDLCDRYLLFNDIRVCEELLEDSK